MMLMKYQRAMCRLTLLTMSVMALFSLAIVDLSVAADDITPPQLLSLAIDPTTVDVSVQPQTVTFTARITDDISGFTSGIITITSPSGNQSSSANAVSSSGDSRDGVWTFPVTINKLAETGTWKVTQIHLQDNAGNVSSFTEAQGIQVTASNKIPQLQSLAIAPTTVDVSTQAQTVTFTARITDNLADFNWGLITITSPSGNQSSSANAVSSSGTPRDGVWTFPVTVNPSAETGTWKVTQILLQDSAGNVSSFTEAQGIQVTANKTPQLQSLAIAPTTVDVSTQAQTVTFTARITDNLADFNWGVITITSPSGNQSSAANAVFSSGTPRDGFWTFPVTINKSAETGTWRVTQILLQDSAGNASSFTEAQGIQVTANIQTPQLQSLLIAPTTVDVRTQPQTVTFTARITDSLADFNWGVITITSPSGNQSSAANAVFSSGTLRDGFWTFPVTINKSAETGTWRVTQIRLQDSAGNISSYADARGIQVTGAADIIPPQLQSLSVAPITVDPITQLQTISFLARITDNLSGFSWGLLTMTGPLGNQLAANAVLSSGNSLDGVWIFSITAQQPIEIANWKVTQILLQDSAGNISSYTEAREIITLPPLTGDVNLDGSVDLKDAILALQVLSRITPAETIYKEAGTGGGNKIGMAEVIYILQKAAGLR